MMDEMDTAGGTEAIDVLGGLGWIPLQSAPKNVVANDRPRGLEVRSDYTIPYCTVQFALRGSTHHSLFIAYSSTLSIRTSSWQCTQAVGVNPVWGGNRCK